MNTIPFTRKEKHDDKPSEEIQESIQESIQTSEHEMNTMEGSEFLDDGIRTKDQPFCETTVKENE